MRKGKKTRVFLGAYINQTNAQNLNCRALATYIDKSKFEVLSLTIGHGNLGKVDIPGVKVFNCRYPVKITQYLGYFWGILLCDVAYLPRGNNYKYQKWLLKLIRRKSFKTIENIIDEDALSTAFSSLGHIDQVKESFSFTTKLYSITSYMKKYNFDAYQIASEEVILPLATDTLTFKEIASVKERLTSIIFLSNDMKRKRVNEYLELSENFPDLTFHIVGSDRHGFLKGIMDKGIYSNVIYHGMQDHKNLKDILRKCQLHILMSKSEGFPRGIIECAAAGLPSFVYPDYGASEWITHGVDGMVCKDYSDFSKYLRETLVDDALMTRLSQGALQIAEEFGVEKVTKLYENEIISLVNE